MNENNLQQGFVKLYRSFTKWEWYDDINTRLVFIHLLLTVNYEPKPWHGITINRGQIVTSYGKLAQDVGLSVQQTRTALNRLKSTREITSEGHASYSVITIKNYDDYQKNNKVDNKQLTSEQQATNKQLTTTKEIKNIKNINTTTTTYTENENFKFFGYYKNVGLTKSDYRKLQTLTQSTERLNKLIDELDVAIETQKEKPYNAEFIHAHYERLKAFYEYKLKHPAGNGTTNTVRYKTAEERKEEKLKEILGRMNKNESG